MEKFKKLGMLVIGMALVTLTSMSMGYGSVTIGLAGSGADYIDNGSGNNIYAAMNAAAAGTDKTLIILEGTYPGFPAVYIYNAGLTIMGEPGKIVKFTGAPQFYVLADGVTIEGLRIESTYYAGAMRVDNNKNVSFLNNYLTSTNPSYGSILIYFGNVNGLKIAGNVIYSSPGGEGVPPVYGWSSGTGPVLIDHNTFYGYTGWGFLLYGNGVTITNNIINTSSGNTIYVYSGSASYNAGVPSFWSSVSGTGNISVPLAGLFYSTNPADSQFLYLACNAPSSVLTGSSTGGFIGALPKSPNCNTPPVANAGSDQLDVQATSPVGANITLSGSGSTLGDGNHLHYHWVSDMGTVTEDGVNPDSVETANAVLTLGVNKTAIVTLTVYDANASHVEDDSDSDELTANVIDTTIPVVEILKPQDGEVSPSAAIPVKVHVTDNTATTVSVSMNERIFVINANGIAEGLLIQPNEEIEITAVAVDLGSNTGSDTNTLIKVHDLGKSGK